MLRRPARAVSTHEWGPIPPSFETPARRGLLRTRSVILRKRLNTGDGASEDQGVNVVGTFVGIHRLQVLGVAHDLELRSRPNEAVAIALRN